MKPISLTPVQWDVLKTRLTNDYSPSVMMIRNRMKEVLGFTPRNHVVWVPYGKHNHKSRPISTVHLDWFSEPKRTMFILKYSEYFEKPKD